MPTATELARMLEVIRAENQRLRAALDEANAALEKITQHPAGINNVPDKAPYTFPINGNEIGKERF